MLVAAERRFREVVGVDLSAELVEIARANAAIMQARQSGRAPIRVVVGDAANYPLPSGDLVLFLYNPFGAPLVTQFLTGWSGPSGPSGAPSTSSITTPCMEECTTRRRS